MFGAGNMQREGSFTAETSRPFVYRKSKVQRTEAASTSQQEVGSLATYQISGESTKNWKMCVQAACCHISPG